MDGGPVMEIFLFQKDPLRRDSQVEVYQTRVRRAMVIVPRSWMSQPTLIWESSFVLNNSFTSACFCAGQSFIMLVLSIVVGLCHISIAILHVTVSAPLLSSSCVALVVLATLLLDGCTSVDQ